MVRLMSLCPQSLLGIFQSKNVITYSGCASSCGKPGTKASGLWYMLLSIILRSSTDFITSIYLVAPAPAYPVRWQECLLVYISSASSFGNNCASSTVILSPNTPHGLFCKFLMLICECCTGYPDRNLLLVIGIFLFFYYASITDDSRS